LCRFDLKVRYQSVIGVIVGSPLLGFDFLDLMKMLITGNQNELMLFGKGCYPDIVFRAKESIRAPFALLCADLAAPK